MPMATQTPPALSSDVAEIKIISHSNLFYWWPVWAIGFLMFLLTWIDGHRMVIVPDGTKALTDARVEETPGKPVLRDALVVPENSHLLRDPNNHPAQPFLRMAVSKSYGVLYAIILLLVIVITNMHLRGLWSVIVLVIIVALSIIFALAGWWDDILNALGRLHIHINAAGYLLISTALFVIWLVTFVFFDSRVYMVFTPGQLRVRQEIGGGEAAYDTTGMVVQKQRNDLFRHWILGLGSGDLIVNTSGAHAHQFDLPNVLFVGTKVKQIEEMLREKPIVRG
jgi:hypothetical protein